MTVEGQELTIPSHDIMLAIKPQLEKELEDTIDGKVETYMENYTSDHIETWMDDNLAGKISDTFDMDDYEQDIEYIVERVVENNLPSEWDELPTEVESLTEKELSEVARVTHERTYKKDEHVFKKLSPAEGMYVILDGQVSIIDPDSETIFATLESGDFFGELALLDEEPRSASSIAKIPSRLIGFFRTDLLTLMKRSPELGNKILINLSRVLGERLRRTNQELAKPNH